MATAPFRSDLPRKGKTEKKPSASQPESFFSLLIFPYYSCKIIINQ
jgi:hypothetical protein